jgi:hypothetical protein
MIKPYVHVYTECIPIASLTGELEAMCERAFSQKCVHSECVHYHRHYFNLNVCNSLKTSIGYAQSKETKRKFRLIRL